MDVEDWGFYIAVLVVSVSLALLLLGVVDAMIGDRGNTSPEYERGVLHGREECAKSARMK